MSRRHNPGPRAGGEDELISWLTSLQPGSGPHLPGDDAAILGRGTAARALTTDQQIAGVHVPPDLDVGVWARRLLAVNLSDLAAMGAEPQAALLTLAAPPGFELRKFLRAAVDACRQAGIHLAGGDVASAAHAVTSMTVIGRRPPGHHWVSRRAGRPGDRLWLGGAVGASAVGQRLVARGARLTGRGVRLPADQSLSPALGRLAKRAVRRHLEPQPQLSLGRWLGSRRRSAAIDVSDGLAQDLWRLCRASGVGAVVDAEAIPIDRAVHALAPRLGETALDLALGGGEDYVLLFALPPRSAPPSSYDTVAIGRLLESSGITFERSGRKLRVPDGWDHLRRGPRVGTGRRG